MHRSFIRRHLDLRADVYAAADQPSAAATATTTTRQSLEADNLNLRATARRQTQHIADLEARLSELLGEQAYSRTANSWVNSTSRRRGMVSMAAAARSKMRPARADVLRPLDVIRIQLGSDSEKVQRVAEGAARPCGVG